ncbi:hypothetical protein AJ80_05305 [Polytolypa hystricis UAMH7299]|uniref:Ribosomal protein L20 n=1 Tax=Polytolypa hystricis (strain UAMH7299) TaxID=1447883 RepID=A0A2B7Y4D1_POLH7|nr:hypothetical protein AJ80_05305 [Polytolypa hystricis UAMH7299]
MALSFTFSRRHVVNLPFLLPAWSESLPLVIRRNQSSYRRTKQRLRVKPDASFSPSANETQDHIIYNPPSSAPSVYHTPTIFLPSNDIRRKLRSDAPSIDSEEAKKLPLVFKSTTQTGQILGEQQINEMRQLRLQDPITWSRYKLAKRFNCSPLFVAQVCEVSQEKKEMQQNILEAVKSRWGTKRTIAREARELRKERWARDQ